MRTLLLSASALALGATGALAEGHGDKCFDKGTLSYVDCPADTEAVVMEPLPEPAPTFTAFYIGAFAGVAGAGFDGVFDNEEDDGGKIVSLDDAFGGVLGAYIGAQYQFDNGVVLGAEIDGAFGLELDDEDTRADDVELIGAEVEYLASARLRAGYAFDDIMPFVTAGVGLVGIQYEASDDFDDPTPDGDDFSDSETEFAAVFGGGVEYLVTDYAMFRIEGMYYALDDARYSLFDKLDDSDPGDFVEVDDIWMIRAGLGFSF